MLVFVLMVGNVVWGVNALCESENSCNSCSYRNDCVWENDLCVHSDNGNGGEWYQRIEHACVQHKQNEYCGMIQMQNDNMYSLSLPKISSQYGSEFLFCSYSIPLSNTTASILSTSFINKTTNTQLNYIISYSNNTISHINISNLSPNTSIYIEHVSSFQIVFYTNQPLPSSPFTINLTINPSNKQSVPSSAKKHSLLITIIAVVISIILSFLIPYICCVVLKKKQTARTQHPHPYPHSHDIARQKEIESNISKLHHLFESELKGKQYDQYITLKDNNNVCTICLDKLHNDQPISQLKCSHFFHEECLKCWLTRNAHHQHPRCPNCNGLVFAMYDSSKSPRIPTDTTGMEQNPRTRANSGDTEQEMLGSPINNNNANNTDIIHPTIIVINPPMQE